MALIQWDPHLILPRESSVCLGTFDGVHLGHQALLEKCVHRAVEKSLRPVAFTFSNIPFGSSKAPLLPPLTTLEEKEQRMSSAGIKDVVFTVFNEEFASISEEDFFEQILLKQLHAKHVVIGFHYHFGKMASGNAESMRKMCESRQITCDIVPPILTEDGTLISSTAIRHLILEGNYREAEKMLGYPLSTQQKTRLGGCTDE